MKTLIISLFLLLNFSFANMPMSCENKHNTAPTESLMTDVKSETKSDNALDKLDMLLVEKICVIHAFKTTKLSEIIAYNTDHYPYSLYTPPRFS